MARTQHDTDPRGAAYAHPLLRGCFRLAARIPLDPTVPLCGATAEAFGDERYRQVCVLPAGHPDRLDLEVYLLTHGEYPADWGHLGWQTMPPCPVQLTPGVPLGRFRPPLAGWRW